MQLSAQVSRMSAAAESLYLNRDYDSLSQVADVLCSLPHEGAQSAGMLYKARCLYRADRTDGRIISLLESASETGPAKTGARAIQALGVVYSRLGNLPEAARLSREAMRAGDLLTRLRAAFMLSEVASMEGDHQRAFDELRIFRPVVEIVSKVQPYFAGLYCNEIAYDLAQLGRIEEARRFAAFAVSSPFARAYPEWRETAREIEQAREPIAAHKSILCVVVRPARAKARKPIPRTLFLIQKLALKASRRRLQPRTAIFTRELPRSRPTLEQVSLKIKIRAPSF